ncbi:MAG: transketolase C-terminal domain-containing protein [Pseudomonadota bacterium]
MGDQIGSAVSGTLYYVAPDEYQRVKNTSLDPRVRTGILANLNRLNALYMIGRAGSGHIGTSFSSLDIVSWIVHEQLEGDDVYFSSKGHDVPGFYSCLIGAGRLDFENLHKLRRLNGLPGHPDVSVDGIETNTGSLGMGVSKAKGMVWADRLKKKQRRIYVLTGDGELQEGQFWESLSSAVNHDMHQITVIVDHNKLQSDTFVSEVSDLGDLDGKLNAFGWHTQRVDGHDLAALAQALKNAAAETGKPSIIIADTIKGKGVTMFEHTQFDSSQGTYAYHSGAPSAEEYRLAVNQLIESLNREFETHGLDLLRLESIEQAATSAPQNQERLLPAYSDAVLAQAAKHENLVALDADLVLDMGLIPFQQAYPDRFIECGIAEQDMVSQAGALALNGFLPIANSFACFLCSRPNEQIYNNATERTKVIYVGALAGLLPAGPGHSHQCLHDIAALKGTPNITIMEPGAPCEVGELLDWAVNHATGPCYMRLLSIPFEPNFRLPDTPLVHGRGRTVREGSQACLITYSPVMLIEAMGAADLLANDGIDVQVIDMPWLNTVDDRWLADTVGGRPLITLDNHTVAGGMGETLAGPSGTTIILQIGVDEIPRCGSNQEVLEHHKVDSGSLFIRIKDFLASI